jgi:glycosyltransferase involved in cell wall biosynthesis
MTAQAPRKNLLTVILPVYNEADCLPLFLPEVISLCEKNQWQLIIVDDGSVDASTKILESYNHEDFIRVIHHKVNRGYGGALKSGIAASTTPHLITIDGDGQHNLADIAVVYQFAIDKDADLVVGNRGKNQFTNAFREVGKSIIRNLTRILMPLPIRDLNSGFKLYKTELAKRYSVICPNSMAFSDVITLTFISQRNLVLDHPITVHPRKGGKSKIRVQTALDTVMEIINISLMFNPLRIFLPTSLFCIIVGVGWGIPILLSGRGVSVGSMLAIVIGLLLFALGLIASQLAAIRMGMLNQ